MRAMNIQAGQVYEYGGEMFRAVADGCRPAVNIETGQEHSLGPLVQVELVDSDVEEVEAQCEYCGVMQPVSALTRRQENYYDWDDPDEDRQGSVLHTRTVWECRDREPCLHQRRLSYTATDDSHLFQRGIGQGWGSE